MWREPHVLPAPPAGETCTGRWGRRHTSGQSAWVFGSLRDRKTGTEVPAGSAREYELPPKSWKIDPWRAWLRERWEQGVHNASRLFGEMRKRGYDGCYTQVKKAVREGRSEGRERASVRFETAPGEQAQMDWGISATGVAGGCMGLR
ncbi:MAG: hypothetical protein ABI076_07115 [Acidobacteriaceae bacterium]